MGNFSYIGPYTSAAFTAGIFNDAWDAAVDMSDSLIPLAEGMAKGEGAFKKILPREIGEEEGTSAYFGPPGGGGTGTPESDLFNVNAPELIRSGMRSSHAPAVGAMQLSAQEPAQAGALRRGLDAQLRGMIKTLLQKFYPFYEIPDARAAWEGVVSQFGDEGLKDAMQRIVGRSNDMFNTLGLRIPGQAMAYHRRQLQATADSALSLHPKNQEIIRLGSLIRLDLARYENLIDTQQQSLEAARAFLLSVLQPMDRKVNEDRLMLLQMREKNTSMYFRFIDTLLKQNEGALARTLFESQREIDKEVWDAQHLTESFDAYVKSQVEYIQQIGQRAAAAISRMSGEVSITGDEREAE